MVFDIESQKEVKEFDYLLPCAMQITINDDVYLPCSSFYDSDTEYLTIFVTILRKIKL